jgi:flagellar biogenesis protein FliO
MAMAMLVSGLTWASSPDSLAPPATAAATEPATPLQTRPTTRLFQEPGPTHSSMGLWRALGIVIAAGGVLAVWMLRTKRAAQPNDSRLNVLRRLAVGVRSEIVLIELEGQHILLGVTPRGIRNLHVVADASVDDAPTVESTWTLETPPDPVVVSEDPSAGSAGLNETKRFRRSVSSGPGPEDAPVEGQARGLVSIGQRR